MYQVITIYGENEPWWFFDEWQEDIIEEKEFDTFDDARNFFQKKSKEFIKEYEHERTKEGYLSAFWNDGELKYCEDCDEELQAYKGLMLVKDYQKLDDGECGKNETTNHCGKTKCCTRHS